MFHGLSPNKKYYMKERLIYDDIVYYLLTKNNKIIAIFDDINDLSEYTDKLYNINIYSKLKCILSYEILAICVWYLLFL